MCLTRLITDREFPHEGTAYKVLLRTHDGILAPFEHTPMETGKWLQALTEPERISEFGRGPEYRNGFHLYAEMPSEEALREIYGHWHASSILVEVRYRGVLAYGMSRTYITADEPTLVVREIFIPEDLTPVGKPDDC